jgi:beta-galactosidase
MLKDSFWCFDGVYIDSSVYVNQQFEGVWKYGYCSFEHEITHALVDGDNGILVKVVHRSRNSRWYSGTGIYRNVWLKTREKNHIVTDGVYINKKQLVAAGSGFSTHNLQTLFVEDPLL